MSYEVALAVKEYLVNLAVEDKLPLDMTMLDELAIQNVIAKATPMFVLGWSKADVEQMVDTLNENRNPDNQIEYSDEFAEQVLHTMDLDADFGIGVSWTNVENAVLKCWGE